MPFFKKYKFTIEMALTSNLKSRLEGLGSTWLNQTRYPDVEEGPKIHLVLVSYEAERSLGFAGLKCEKISIFIYKSIFIFFGAYEHAPLVLHQTPL